MKKMMRNIFLDTENVADDIIIQPNENGFTLGLGELWRFRELFFFLAWRDIKVRYKQTFLGVAWAIINPVMQMLVWAFVFGKIAQLPSEGVPYILITLSGTLCWSYFTEIVNGASSSLISNTNLVTKIYFPRIIIPLSVVLRALMDFIIGLFVLVGMMLHLKTFSIFSIIYLAGFLLIASFVAIGVGLWVSALSVKYRDLAKILPYFIQMAFFLTPVAYLGTTIPAKYQWISYLNPMAGTIDGFRWALLGFPVNWFKVLSCLIISIVLLFSGIIYFRNFERSFADLI